MEGNVNGCVECNVNGCVEGNGNVESNGVVVVSLSV